MATKRDLAEAHQFSRRRLVSTFVSGAPGDYEPEAARPWRPVAGGLVLAVILVAVDAVTGFVLGHDTGWEPPTNGVAAALSHVVTHAGRSAGEDR